MKTASLWALIVLNAVLLLSFLGLHIHENSARAQAAGARRPGEYLMIDGTISGSTAGVVYVVDTVNGQLIAMSYTGQAGANTTGIESMPPIDLNAVFAQQPMPTGPKPRRY